MNHSLTGNNRQRGMTTLGLLMLLGIIAFFSTIAIKLTPVYLEEYKVKSVLDNMKSDGSLADATDHEIKSTLERRFDVNDIDDVRPNEVIIGRDGLHVQSLAFKYEVRVPMFWNIDAVVHFKEGIEVGR